MSKGQVWFLAPFYCVINNFWKSLKISCRARLRLRRVKKRKTSKESARSIINMMLALQGISILIAILVPKCISLNILQLLTNTFNGWWQMGNFRVELKWTVMRVEKGEAKHVCFSLTGSVFHHPHPQPCTLCPEHPHILGLQAQQFSSDAKGQKDKTMQLMNCVLKVIPECERVLTAACWIWCLLPL